MKRPRVIFTRLRWCLPPPLGGAWPTRSYVFGMNYGLEAQMPRDAVVRSRAWSGTGVRVQSEQSFDSSAESSVPPRVLTLRVEAGRGCVSSGSMTSITKRR